MIERMKRISKVQEVVSNLLADINKRNSKIQEKISALQDEVNNHKNSIDGLMRELVNCDLAGDEKGQEAANKKIAQLKAKLDDILSRIAAYKGASVDQSIIQAWIPKVIEVAKKESDDRYNDLDKKKEQRDKLEQEIKDKQKELDALDNEWSRLRNQSEAKAMLPLLKYIEPRKIKFLQEESYLRAIINGHSGEFLDQYIEPPREEYGIERKVTHVGPSPEEREAARQPGPEPVCVGRMDGNGSVKMY